MYPSMMPGMQMPFGGAPKFRNMKLDNTGKGKKGKIVN
jgi:hypothetical protein